VSISTLRVSDSAFDDALERFALVQESIVLRTELNRPLEDDEILDRYAFTAFVEALRSEEFDESPFSTAEDLELNQDFASEDEAWEAIKDFYAARACTLLIVGDAEEFIIGEEIARKLGLQKP
jgi:hypothetical protein